MTMHKITQIEIYKLHTWYYSKINLQGSVLVPGQGIQIYLCLLTIQTSDKKQILFNKKKINLNINIFIYIYLLFYYIYNIIKQDIRMYIYICCV